MFDAAEDVALFKLGEVQPGAEMLAVAGEHDGADIVRQRVEERLDALHGRVVERIAFLRAMQPQHGDSRRAVRRAAKVAERKSPKRDRSRRARRIDGPSALHVPGTASRRSEIQPRS